ncbi:MAG: 4-alpha-glucanotransferase [Spirochaetaceae bacterium]|jgi:4-alpha-glucanotransferase|nr:4-alpha-glucanotransferase [Spirochaetaceae bacterium]
MSSNQDKRLIGTVVPVGALRGSRSIGVGEFPDLIEFGELCKTMGIGLIQILPVNDTGYESSPYGALTAFALHPLYLRIGDMPEAEGFSRKLAEIRETFEGEARFPYGAIIRAKITMLRDIYREHERFVAERAESGGPLGRWIEENQWVKEYAVYRRLKEAHGEKSWKEWISHREPEKQEIESLWNDRSVRGEHLFWAWVQEALDAQFGAASARLRDAGIILEGDLPILMNEDSCDVWAHGGYFNSGLSAGAPPDMYSPKGQNWGFPIYNWEAHEKDDYAWWRQRLAVAAKYYHAYRIDHVLGFFRIWASRREDNSAMLGRYVPSLPLTDKALKAGGFDEARIRWFSRPHIPGSEVWESLKTGGLDGADLASEAERVFRQALDRIGGEDLWLFKDDIAGEKAIERLPLHQSARAYLLGAWGNRLLVEYGKGTYTPTWHYKDSRAYGSLNDGEREALEALLEKQRRDSEKDWEKQGKKLLTVLTRSSSMLPCAEDLGAVPACVPKTLKKLSVFGLRVVRWFRLWAEEGQPYVPFGEYPELSVCTPAVHDSSTLREWWEEEADRQGFTDFIGEPSLPPVYNPGTAQKILKKIASAASRFRVFQIQDLLHLSPRWYAADPASERINVPGTSNEFNWTYRLPAKISEIAKDGELIQKVRDLGTVKGAPRAKKPASQPPAV